MVAIDSCGDQKNDAICIEMFHFRFVGNGRGAGSSWGSNSATDMTLSSREPSGSGSSSLFAMHPMSEPESSNGPQVPIRSLASQAAIPSAMPFSGVVGIYRLMDKASLFYGCSGHLAHA